jgi:hypothetical protein
MATTTCLRNDRSNALFPKNLNPVLHAIEKRPADYLHAQEHSLICQAIKMLAELSRVEDGERSELLRLEARNMATTMADVFFG